MSSLQEFVSDHIQCIPGSDGDLDVGSNSIVRCGFCDSHGCVAVILYQSKNICRMVRELKILQEIRHDNVIQVFGWTRTERVIGVVMEYMCYGSLASLNLQNPSLSPLLRYRMCFEIACGIAHLHSIETSSNLIHGDITLENILLSDTLQCKIKGFDDKSFHADSVSSPSISTKKNPFNLLYAPPEILHNPSERKMPFHDVYSFGVIATELIGWKRPSSHLIPICLESIKMGKRPDLLNIDLLDQILNEDDENAKSIMDMLIGQIEICRKQATADRAKMADVKRNLEEFWKKCDTSQLQIDVQQVQKSLSPGINPNKENYSLISLNSLIPTLFSLSIADREVDKCKEPKSASIASDSAGILILDETQDDVDSASKAGKGDNLSPRIKSIPSFRRPKAGMLLTKSLNNIISSIRDEDVLLLHCCGLPGCGKTQLVCQLENRFPFANAVEGKVVNWCIRYKEGHTIKPRLIELAERLHHYNYVTDQEHCEAIQNDLEHNTANTLVDVLYCSSASVLVVIEDLEETDPLLTDLLRCLEELRSKKPPSLKFHVYVTSRRTSAVCGKDEIRAFRENGHLKYETMTLDGFDRSEAVEHLCKNRKDCEDEKEAAEKIFERFSGLPLAMQIARNYCSQCNYKKYLEEMKTLSLQTILENEFNSTPKDYSQPHPFQSIAYPLVGTSTGMGVELLHWNYLACLAHLYIECIPEIIWKTFYRNLDDRSRSKPGDLDKEAENLIKNLVDWSSCSISENKDICFKRIVANAFLFTRQKYTADSKDDFNSLKTSIEIMCNMVAKKGDKESLKQFCQHLLCLKHDADENESITSKEKKKLAKCIKTCSK